MSTGHGDDSRSSDAKVGVWEDRVTWLCGCPGPEPGRHLFSQRDKRKTPASMNECHRCGYQQPPIVRVLDDGTVLIADSTGKLDSMSDEEIAAFAKGGRQLAEGEHRSNDAPVGFNHQCGAIEGRDRCFTTANRWFVVTTDGMHLALCDMHADRERERKILQLLRHLARPRRGAGQADPAPARPQDGEHHGRLHQGGRVLRHGRDRDPFP